MAYEPASLEICQFGFDRIGEDPYAAGPAIVSNPAQGIKGRWRGRGLWHSEQQGPARELVVD
jgi:hypothetical protein